MKFNLVFENSNDVIPFEVKFNHDLIRWFIKKANTDGKNKFHCPGLFNECSARLHDISWALGKTNEILYLLYGTNFPENENILDYLDQKFLNKQHELWVNSQYHEVNLDTLISSMDSNIARIGRKLHDLYPDDVRVVKLAEAMTKLGYLYPYEEVNMTVHRLESLFATRLEFKSDSKWNVFENKFKDNFVSNNDVVNFSFGYTYVGRQYYNKWKFFDSYLTCSDHYNYEQLEWAFQMNLDMPETIPFSEEFIEWSKKNKVPPISTQIPIANIIGLEDNLHEYRKILYINSKKNNYASLQLI